MLLILLFIYLMYHDQQHFEHFEERPIIFTYWETKKGRRKPEYIDLCFDTLVKHCDNDFDVVLLNEKSVYTYLPNMRKDLDKLQMAQKTDYIRCALLYTYGGIWVDADTIIMSSLTDIVKKIEKYDYVGFGCSENVCYNGYPKPSNGVMAAKKGSILMKNVLMDLDEMINKKSKFEYFDLGKLCIWRNIQKLMKGGYDYYHFPSEYDGTRDSDGKWVNVDNHVSHEKTALIDENKLFFVFLENNKFDGDNPKYNWFGKLSKNEVLEGPYWVSQLFRKSLGTQ